MPRLRNRETGSVVNVSEETAARLVGVYEPVDEKPRASAKKTSHGKAAPSKSADK